MHIRHLLRVGAAALLTAGFAAFGGGSAGAASGDLDPTFGGDGTVDSGRTGAEDVTTVGTQPDGKVVLVSRGLTGTTVERFNADGSPDAGFGAGGVTTLPMDVLAKELLAASDGGIVVVGTAGGVESEPGLVLKLTSAGQPDPAFSADGYVILTGGDTHALINLTTVYEQGGGLVVAGDKWTLDDNGIINFGVDGGVYAARLSLANGSLDNTFGTGGESFSHDLTPSGVCGFEVFGAVPQPGGNTILPDLYRCGSGGSFGSYQLTSGGTLTVLNDDVASMMGGSAAGAVPLPGGGMLVAAHAIQAPIGSSNVFLTVNGAGHVTSTYTEDATLAVNDLAALPDGRIATSASDINGAPAGGVQVRSITGQLDPSFAGDGTADTNRPVWGVAAAADAKLVTVGTGPNNIQAFGQTYNLPELARYQLGGGAPALTPLTPARILDTRDGIGYSGPKPGADTTITLQVAGRGGVPATGAAAVVLNVTATESDAPGFVTVWPSDQPRPLASNLNLSSAGQSIPNLVTVPVGADGAVKLYTLSGAHLIADVAAWYPPGAGFVPLTPNRILDTRSPGIGYTGPKPAAGATVDLAVAGHGGVPATGATAVVMNVTATESDGPGFVTAWPSGAPRPVASNLNLTQAGQTIPNQVYVPLGANGSVSLFTFSGAHLIADVAGYFTTGGFTPLSPDRILDTRSPAIGYSGPKPGAGATVAIQVAGAGGVPATGATAVVMNVTATEADGPGFVTAWPSGSTQPVASNLNLTQAGQTIANLVLVPIGPDGKVLLYTLQGTHLVADVAGYIS